jgi:hypothetical protein
MMTVVVVYVEPLNGSMNISSAAVLKVPKNGDDHRAAAALMDIKVHK